MKGGNFSMYDVTLDVYNIRVLFSNYDAWEGKGTGLGRVHLSLNRKIDLFSFSDCQYHDYDTTVATIVSRNLFPVRILPHLIFLTEPLLYKFFFVYHALSCQFSFLELESPLYIWLKLPET